MQIIQCNNNQVDLDDNLKAVCDRHIRLFGESLQQKLSSLTVGIIGAGGLGSILVEQVMRLYPQKMIIIDKDHVEMSNLNRLTNATLNDAQNRTSKVDVVKRAVIANNPEQVIKIINGDFLEKENQEIFKECDLIFGALDSIGVRFAINQLAVANAIPYFDCGTGIIIEDKIIKHVGGQVIAIMPDSGFCLHCGNLFDRQEAMQELLDDEEHKRLEHMGYIKGADVIAPQVYALNMQVASTAVWLFMRILSGERFSFHGIKIDAKEFRQIPWKNETHDNKDCLVCGKHGVAFLGDEAELLCKDRTSVQVTITENNRPNEPIVEDISLFYPRIIIGADYCNASIYGMFNY